MVNKKIYILDNDESQTEVLFNLIAEDQYEGRLFDSIDALTTAISEQIPALSLIDYHNLLKSDRQDVVRLFQIMKNQEISVYNVPEDAARRLAFYDLGARRVYDSGHSLEEMYFSLRWLMRIVTDEENRLHQNAHGNIEDIPLEVLIPVFSSERRSGVLSLNSSSGSGKIYFYDGSIVNAQTGPHSGEEAFYHMLLWDSGRFVFMSIADLKPENKIPLSNYGLLIKGRRLKEEFKALISKIAPLQNVIRASRLGDLKMSGLDIKPGFLDFIRRPHTLEEVIENAFYTALETVNVLVYLKEGDFLIINEPAGFEAPLSEDEEKKADVHLTLSENEFEALLKNLKISDQSTAKIVVISADKKSRTSFIGDIAGQYRSGGGSEDLEIGRVCINEKLNIYLIGLEMNQKAAEAVNQIFGGLAGFIFLIDGKEADQFEYLNYVMNQILSDKPLPSVCAVYNIPEHETVSGIRKKFTAPKQLIWIKKPEDSLNLLFSVYPIDGEEQAESENEEKDEQE